MVIIMIMMPQRIKSREEKNSSNRREQIEIDVEYLDKVKLISVQIRRGRMTTQLQAY